MKERVKISHKDPDRFKKMGQIGGKAQVPKGFAMNKELALSGAKASVAARGMKLLPLDTAQIIHDKYHNDLEDGKKKWTQVTLGKMFGVNSYQVGRIARREGRFSVLVDNSKLKEEPND